MVPDTFARLAVDEDLRVAMQHAHTDAPTPTPTAEALPSHLLHLAACRMREGVAPPRCYYWYGGKPPVRLDGRVI